MKKGLFCMLFGLFGCAQIPEGIEPVGNFQLDRYLGVWYEIARMDHSFERGLNNVTATYSMREDGGVKVVNRGFNSTDNEWSQAEGRAYFYDSPNVGQLRVSFFRPFYGAYNIIELDDAYSYAMICGNTKSYFWILSRTPQLQESVLNRLLEKAKNLGFDTGALIYVKQDGAKP